MYIPSRDHDRYLRLQSSCLHPSLCQLIFPGVDNDGKSVRYRTILNKRRYILWQLVVSKLYSRSVGGAGEVELLDRRHLRALKVSCGWWRPGHVTPVLASDWSPCPGSVRHHPCAGLHLRPHPGRAQPPGLPGQLSALVNNICGEVLTIPWSRVSALPY